MTVLCYHAVNPVWTSPISMDPQAFGAQVEWLAAHRPVIPLTEAVRHLDGSGRLPRRAVALTFDDGFASVHGHAWPALARLRLPATVFLVSRTLSEAGQDVDWIDTPPPYETRTLTVDQVLEMQQDGVAFESHSATHADLTRLSHAECLADLRDSREELEAVLGRPVRLLAYPRGRHAPHVRDAAQRAGYTHAFALPEGPEEVGPYSLPRVGLYRGNGVRDLRLKLAPGYLAVRTGRPFRAARRAGRAVAGVRR
jgi:peptidoglycan/xylan/chitin deacetylase (PgdA/CDA1 family)